MSRERKTSSEKNKKKSEKTLDKPPKRCYNKDTVKKERVATYRKKGI